MIPMPEPAKKAPPLLDGSRYIPVLDGWRAVAILCVLLFHALYNSDLTGHTRLQALSAASGKLGAMGVLIFFCISGYLITLRLVADSQKGHNFSLRRFYVKRAFRILPPLIVFLLTLVALHLAGLIQLSRGDWAAPFFLSNYINGSWYTSHFWSLSVEEHFYLLWPGCILLLGWRRAMWVGVAIIAAVAVWRPLHLHGVTDQAAQARALQHTDMRLDYIMMGCVVALAMLFYPRLQLAFRWFGSTAGILLLLIALALTTRAGHIDLRSVQAAILTLMVCGSAMTENRLLGLLLANPAMLWLGRISYSVYIWQQLFFTEATPAWLRSPAALPLKLGAILAASCLSYFLVEKPCIGFGRGLLRRRPVAVSA
jgi:peptidoglycan/LPS O-acetylase OafA/YrhL